MPKIAGLQEQDAADMAAYLATLGKPDPAPAFSPSVLTLMPSRNSPTPPSTEITVAMRAIQHTGRGARPANFRSIDR